jgi:hypothetical protein
MHTEILLECLTGRNPLGYLERWEDHIMMHHPETGWNDSV